MIKEFKRDELLVKVYETREEMGKSCSNEVIAHIKNLLTKQSEVRMIFAAAPSQNDVLKALVESKEIDWSKVVAFHMDEYHTLPKNSDKRFGYFLDQKIFKKVNFKAVYYMCGRDGVDLDKQIIEYEELVTAKPIDICLLGIGENGHLAFNDPPVADFKDKKIIKTVTLDEVCRYQQLHDAKFASIDDVPKIALTLTIPTLLASKRLFCIVPTERKHEAVKNSLNGPISEACPASILRKTANVTLYIDKDCYKDGL